MENKNKHKELCQMAIDWLYTRHCSVFANEVPTWNGIADAIGIITNGKPTVYYVECGKSTPPERTTAVGSLKEEASRL